MAAQGNDQTTYIKAPGPPSGSVIAGQLAEGALSRSLEVQTLGPNRTQIHIETTTGVKMTVEAETFTIASDNLGLTVTAQNATSRTESELGMWEGKWPTFELHATDKAVSIRRSRQ
jgi:translation elongation factor EF-Tu-like GTPase